MIRDLLMATRVDADGVTEAEPVAVDLHDDGRMVFTLDDGQRLEFDYDELLAIATGDHVVGSEDRAA